MSRNSLVTSATGPETSSLQGLSTPKLNGTTSNKSRNEPNTSIIEKKPTSFDIAHEIERELARATELLDKNDKEIGVKIDSALKRVSALKQRNK